MMSTEELEKMIAAYQREAPYNRHPEAVRLYPLIGDLLRERVASREPGTLTRSEMFQGLRNLGIELECGGCMQLFYTGDGNGEHAPGCGREQGRALSEVERAVVEAAMRRYLDDPDSLDNSLKLLGACKALAAERAK